MTTDQSPPVSRAFMSRLREVLTARLPADPGWVVWVDGVVEELAAGCVVEDPRLTQIRALCDERDPSGKGSPFERSIWPHEVRRILDAPPVDATASPPVSRASAVEALTQIRALFSDETWWHISEHSLRRKVRAVLDAVSVDATPAHGIDHGALERVLQAFIETRPPMSIRECADRVLALVRSVEGVVLRRCSWDECPGLEKSIPMHEQEDGPELHDLCKNAMIAPEAVRELAGLYQRLAQERKSAS